MLFSLSRRGVVVRPDGARVRFWTILTDVLPSVESAIDAAAHRGEGLYAIGSSCGHVQMRLQMSRDGIKNWGRQRSLDTIRQGGQRDITSKVRRRPPESPV